MRIDGQRLAGNMKLLHMYITDRAAEEPLEFHRVTVECIDSKLMVFWPELLVRGVFTT